MFKNDLTRIRAIVDGSTGSRLNPKVQTQTATSLTPV